MKKYQVYTKEEFYANGTFVVIENEMADNFLIVEFNDSKIGVAWTGGGKPQVELFLNYNLLLIGVNENIIGVDSKTGKIKLSFGLGFPFSFFQEMEYGFFIVSELTVIGINGNDFSINRFIVSSDVIQDVKVEGEKFVVQCLDSTFYA